MEEDHLGILTTEVDEREIGASRLLHCRTCGENLLNEREPRPLGETYASGACHADAIRGVRPDGFFHLGELGIEASADIGEMSLVGIERHGAVGLVYDDELYRGGACVDTDAEVLCCV